MEIYISLSTIPSRFKNIEKTIISIQNQTILPHKIILNIPNSYKRFKQTITEKEMRKLKNKCNHLLEINRTQYDYGPGTKLLGALEIIKNPNSYVLLVDDDIVYHPKTLEMFIKSNVMKEGMAASMNVYNLHFEIINPKGFDIGQGWTGFFIPSSIKDDIFKFYDLIKNEGRVFFDDDIWISYYLYKKGIHIRPIEKLEHKEYNIIDGLKFITWYQMFEPVIDLFYTRLCITNIYKLDQKGHFDFIKSKPIIKYNYKFLITKIVIYILLILILLIIIKFLYNRVTSR